MNVIEFTTRSYPPTERHYGVCSGTLTCNLEKSTGPTGNYCRLAGCEMMVFESYSCYQRGDTPLYMFSIVGASAWSQFKSDPDTSLRIVTIRGTHVIGQALSQVCRDVWLAAIRSGLEGSLSPEAQILLNLTPPQPQAKPPRFTSKYCVSCGVWDGTKTVNFTIPLPHYGKEDRQHVCKSCYTAQGLLNHCLFDKACREGAAREKAALAEARSLCYSVLASDAGESATLADIKPTVETTERLIKLVKETSSYASFRQRSPALDRLSEELLEGRIGVAEFIENMEEDLGMSAQSDMAIMKKEAFKVAGDMGTAMKLLFEYALSETNRQLSNEMVQCILDFFGDMCKNEGVGSVAFFWSQICHIHLCMLPARDDADNQRIDLMENFLVSICTNRSIHLALELVWSHTADLEESLSTAPCSDACRARCFSILNFLCKLEAKILHTNDAWCGKSNILGKLFLPTMDQAKVLLAIDKGGAVVVKDGDADDTVYRQTHGNGILDSKTPEEKLRAIENADYFSSHLSFTTRVCDIAEKLRFMDINDRQNALQEELELLNASGTLGGDPLNHADENGLVRVVRVPSTEGHVFRSKERTPVLLLMEIVSDAISDAEYSNGAEKGAPAELYSNSFHSANESTRSFEDEGPVHPPSPRVAALKRFNDDAPRHSPITPKKNVHQMVSNAIPSKFADLDLPDLNHSTSNGALVDMQSEKSTPQSVEESSEENIGLVEEAVPEDDEYRIDREASTASSEATGPEISSVNITESSSPPEKAVAKQQSKRISSFGSPSQAEHSSLSPTSDIRRNVLNTIMMVSMEGSSITASSSEAFKRSLKDLERQRATELLERSVENEESAESNGPSSDSKAKTGESLSFSEEENETMESIRLLLIQQRVSQGFLSPADAAKVLQHSSLDRTSTSAKSAEMLEAPLAPDEIPTIDAGDVDSRLAGCGPLPPSVLQALTLWKGGIINNGELLELVKKDVEFVRHSVLFDAENINKLNENSAFWGRFAFGERWNEKKSRISSTSPEYKPGHWDLVGVIVKSNDDLRQEAFVMQLIELSNEVFQSSGLEELWLSPYRILATGRKTGIIEMVKNAMSIDALKKRPGYSTGGGLRGHLRRMSDFTADPGEAFKQAQLNFVRSLASYSLLSYIFMFKDRHNGNILLDTTGHLIHIDFGFVFGIAPGGSFSLEMSTPFKLTDEMLEVLGGLKSPLFSEFVTLFCCGFLALQSHCETFYTLVEISARSSTFKCFEQREPSEVLTKLRERFRQDLTKEETVAFALDLIKQAASSYGTKQYDLFQYMSQGIAA